MGDHLQTIINVDELLILFFYKLEYDESRSNRQLSQNGFV